MIILAIISFLGYIYFVFVFVKYQRVAQIVRRYILKDVFSKIYFQRYIFKYIFSKIYSQTLFWKIYSPICILNDPQGISRSPALKESFSLGIFSCLLEFPSKFEVHLGNPGISTNLQESLRIPKNLWDSIIDVVVVCCRCSFKKCCWNSQRIPKCPNPLVSAYP